MTKYQLWDSTTDPQSGHFVVGGVTQAANTGIDVSAAQLAQASFQTGSGDLLWVRAFDGNAWSDWSSFNVNPPVNHAPVVTTPNLVRRPDQTIAVSDMFAVSDADGDTMTKYQVWDSTDDAQSGHFVVGGVTQAANTGIDISAAQLSQSSFQAGTGDLLWVRAFDGNAWSGWSSFNVTLPANQAPVVTTPDLTRGAGQTVAVSDMFSVSDADGDTMTKYQVWDSTPDAQSGHFVVGGVTQAANTGIDISAAQLSQSSFLTGTVGDLLWVRASDGIAWSGWSSFHIAT